MKNNKIQGIVKFLCEYLPIIIFFCAYKFSKSEQPLIEATAYLVASTFVAVIICYIVTKKVAKTALYSAIILGIFGFLTFFFKDERFIKIKPTIINLSFFSILLYGYLRKKPFVGAIFGDKIKMTDDNWIKLSLRFALFFLFIAVLNEIVWRNYSTDLWVKFKVFVAVPLTMIFSMSQIPFLMKNSITTTEKEAGKDKEDE